MTIRNRFIQALSVRMTILSVLSLGCGTSKTDPIAAADLDNNQTVHRNAGIQLVSISTQIGVGRPLHSVTLRRPQRTSAELAQRIIAATTQVAGTLVDDQGLSAWCESSLEDRHGISAGRPFVGDPDIVVSYRPYLDYLSVMKTTQANAVGSLFSRAEAHQVADAALVELGVAGVIQGKYVLARSGTVALSIQGRLPHATDYAFHYFRTIDGIIVSDSWVEVYVNADLVVSKLALRDVEVVSQHPPTTAVRGSEAVDTELRSLIEAEIDEISPDLVVNVLSRPIPAYHLEAYEEESISVPELTMRWAASRGSVVSKSRVSTLGFDASSTLRARHPLLKPTFCADFMPGQQVATEGDEVVIDSSYAMSFMDSRSPLGRCEEGRIFFDASTGAHAFRGVAPGGVLHRIGLRNGDRDPVLCNQDPSSQHHGHCHALTDFASFSDSLPAMADGTVFDLTIHRTFGARTLQISLVDCPEVGGVIDCTLAL